MKLSVVVPVYNVERYVAACIDSLLEQGMPDSDYEILCVDDGSTDRSGEIVEDYARRYRQVTVIHRENGGLSAARNTGIRAAAGEYVYFIDSDDLLERGVLGPLCRMAEEHGLDQLLFGYQRFEDGEEVPSSGQRVDPGRLVLFQDPPEMRRHRAVPAWRTAWNYLLRRSVLVEYGLVFPEGVLFEDAEFNFWLDRCAASCGYLDQKLYHYRQRAGSILRTFMSDEVFPRYIGGRLKLAERHRAVLRSFRAGYPPHLRVPVTEKELEDRVIDEVQGILNFLLSKGDRAMLCQTLEDLRTQDLYPYPLRWRRLIRREPLKKRAIDAVSFLYPVGWYFRIFTIVGTYFPLKR